MYSLVGALLIVGGLYIVLWGKSKEMKTMTQLVPEENGQQELEPIEVVVTNITDPNHKIISPKQ